MEATGHGSSSGSSRPGGARRKRGVRRTIDSRRRRDSRRAPRILPRAGPRPVHRRRRRRTAGQPVSPCAPVAECVRLSLPSTVACVHRRRPFSNNKLLTFPCAWCVCTCDIVRFSCDEPATSAALSQ